MQAQSCFSSTSSRSRYFAIVGAFITASSAHAAILTSVGGVPDFGWALSLNDTNLVVGAPGGAQAGSAYYYANGTVLTLQKPDTGSAPGSSYFGYAVGTSDNRAIIGDFADKAGTSQIQVGAAYYYKNLDSRSAGGDQTVTEALKLQASDGARNAYFGRSVSLSADNALVGAFGDKRSETGKYVGAAYYFKGLDSATADANGVVTETLKLTSDRAANQDSYFGLSLSLSGDNALVSALGVAQSQGEVYYYRGLADATASADGTVKETFVLRASDGAAEDMFGRIVSLEDNAAIVGANGSADNRGAAYYYKDLDSFGAGTVLNETVKLLASDGKAGDEFGFHADLSQNNALVGARLHNSSTGAAYFFKGLNEVAVDSTVTETVMLTASDGKAGDVFGSSVALNGTAFAIGANRADSTGTGKVYTGDIRAFTVLDAGNTKLATGGLSFVAKDDWVIGADTSGNSVTVSRDSVTNIADVANITADGKHVYIGRQAGANNNELQIEGMLLSRQVFVGAAGNSGNALLASFAAVVTADSINLALSNSIGLEGIGLGYGDLFDWLNLQGGIDLFANGSGVTIDNASELLRISDSNGYTLYTAVPEPATYAALFGAAVLGLVLVRRRRLAGSAQAR